MSTKTIVFFSASAFALANCTGTTDPRDANIFDNVANLSSGEYDRQIEAKNREADAIIAANNATQGRIQNLEGQRAANAAAISSLRGEVASLRAQIAAARASAAGDPAKTAQLAALESQAVAVERDVSGGGDASIARAELGRIRSAVRALSS